MVNVTHSESPRTTKRRSCDSVSLILQNIETFICGRHRALIFVTHNANRRPCKLREQWTFLMYLSIFQTSCWTCKTDCSNAGLVLRSLALNRCDYIFATVTRLCKVRILTPWRLTGTRRKQSEAVVGWLYFCGTARAGRAWATHKWQPPRAFHVRLNKSSEGINPCSATEDPAKDFTVDHQNLVSLLVLPLAIWNLEFLGQVSKSCYENSPSQPPHSSPEVCIPAWRFHFGIFMRHGSFRISNIMISAQASSQTNGGENAVCLVHLVFLSVIRHTSKRPSYPSVSPQAESRSKSS